MALRERGGLGGGELPQPGEYGGGLRARVYASLLEGFGDAVRVEAGDRPVFDMDPQGHLISVNAEYGAVRAFCDAVLERGADVVYPAPEVETPDVLRNLAGKFRYYRGLLSRKKHLTRPVYSVHREFFDEDGGVAEAFVLAPGGDLTQVVASMHGGRVVKHMVSANRGGDIVFRMV